MQWAHNVRRQVSIAASSAALVAGLVVASPAAAQQQPVGTYDLRVREVTGGGTVSGAKSVTNATAGSLVTLDLYFVIANGNANQADDGVSSLQGSVRSLAGGLLGNVGGNPQGAAATNNNLAAPFQGPGSQNGYTFDIDGDGDLDLGRDAEFGTPVTDTAFTPQNQYLTASSTAATPGAPIFDTGGAGNAELLIASIPFTVSGSDGTASLQFIPHNAGSGTTGSRRNQRFTVDGISYQVNGAGTGIFGPNSTAVTGAIAQGAPVTISAVPEPGTLGVLALAGTALLARRRRVSQ